MYTIDTYVFSVPTCVVSPHVPAEDGHAGKEPYVVRFNA